MQTKPLEIYAICPMDSIAIGKAKAFDLAKLDEDGISRPFRIVIVRQTPTIYWGYANTCPHEGVWLNIGTGSFFDPTGKFLKCGKHGATFEIDTGICVSGPCEGAKLDSVAVMAMSGDVCISGVRLLEDDGFGFPADDLDETMEIMIHPE